MNDRGFQGADMTTDEIIKLASEAGFHKWYTQPKEHPDHVAVVARFAALVRNAALEEAIKVIEEYRIPVGNSAAGELACEWTRDALADIRGAIRAMKEQT